VEVEERLPYQSGSRQNATNELFGSAAAGAITHDSDIDLLVLEPEPADTRGESVKIRRALDEVR